MPSPEQVAGRQHLGHHGNVLIESHGKDETDRQGCQDKEIQDRGIGIIPSPGTGHEKGHPEELQPEEGLIDLDGIDRTSRHPIDDGPQVVPETGMGISADILIPPGRGDMGIEIGLREVFGLVGKHVIMGHLIADHGLRRYEPHGKHRQE